jgi:hypothetical protein
MLEAPLGEDVHAPVKELSEIPPKKIYPFRYPEPNSSDQVKKLWEKYYKEWWKKNYHQGPFYKLRNMLSRRAMSTGGIDNTLEQEAAVTNFDLEVVRSIAREKRLSVAEFALLMAHPRISRGTLFDLDGDEVNGSHVAETAIGDQERLGMTTKQFRRAYMAAEKIIESREIFYIVPKK